MEAWGNVGADAHRALRVRDDETGSTRPSLVDGAENAVRDWLAPGHYRRGDRLPPEHELAAMLGISRGTLRSALQRLELTGEIVRRQGSGTFVGRIASTVTFGVDRDRVTSCALRPGAAKPVIEVTRVQIDHRAAGARAASALHIGARERVTVITREFAVQGKPSAVNRDVFHPSVTLLPDEEMRRILFTGTKLIDVLQAAELVMSFSRTTISPRLVDPSDRDGRILALGEPTACLEVESLILDAGDEPMVYSWDVIPPGGIQVELVKSMDAPHPVPVTARRQPPLHAARGARGARVRS